LTATPRYHFKLAKDLFSPVQGKENNEQKRTSSRFRALVNQKKKTSDRDSCIEHQG